MRHALTTDERLNAALLVTHFCWRELHDLLVATDDVRDLARLPDGEARAQAVLERALARVPRSERLAGLVRRRLELCHARFLAGWRALPRETRLEATRSARVEDFTRRGLDPGALLWAVASDEHAAVRRAWRPVVERCFPELLPHLGLESR